MTRFVTVTEKIDKARTGLRASLFVHVDFRDDGRVHAVRFSEKGKEDRTLDRILHALGDTVTDIIEKGP